MQIFDIIIIIYVFNAKINMKMSNQKRQLVKWGLPAEVRCEAIKRSSMNGQKVFVYFNKLNVR